MSQSGDSLMLAPHLEVRGEFQRSHVRTAMPPYSELMLSRDLRTEFMISSLHFTLLNIWNAKDQSVANSSSSTPCSYVYDGKPCAVVDNIINVDALERFGNREAERMPFLGKDAGKRRPGDVNYDPRTLYLPPDFSKSLSGAQRFLIAYRDNGGNSNQNIWTRLYFSAPSAGLIGLCFWTVFCLSGGTTSLWLPREKLSVNVEKLVRKGYRVLVVEPTETPEQLEIRRRVEGSKDKVVKHEICAVVTKGTLTEGEMVSANPDASYLVSVTESSSISLDQREERSYGVCVVDVATSRIIIGQIKDDMECSALCSLLSELRPVEIMKPAKQLSPESEKLLARCPRNPLINVLVPDLELWDADKTVREVKSFYSHVNDPSVSSSSEEVNMKPNFGVDDDLSSLPDVINGLLNAGEDGRLALSALGGTLFYLRQAFLDEILLRYSKFELIPCSGFKDVLQKPYMVLDAAALENLEIFENSRNGESSGMLFLALGALIYHFPLNFEKSCLSCRTWSDYFRASLLAANGRNSNKIVLYEDAAKKQLQEFISTLRGCEQMARVCSHLHSVLDNVNSRLLHDLLVPDAGRGLPDIGSIIDHFRDAFDWAEASSSGRIVPCEGVDTEYDSACAKTTEIESALKNYLKQQRKLLGDTCITFVTVGKELYLLEVPEHLRGGVPQDYELRSSKKGFFRYWTPDIKKLLGELSQAESEKESKLKSILQRLVGRFCEHHTKWRKLVSTVAELDVLISLAIASDYYEGPTCHPIISDSSNISSMPHLTAKSLGHPVLRSDSLGKGAFVPNDILIGGSDHASFILLTGPNMGGKSTLLRQVCLAVILAQVGADVPAEQFELSPVDRIFVRMGAKDHIMAGQSTFLTEVSETASMLTCASRDSLVALDELGRGTSTSDGQAIVESVLEYFVRKVHCRGMFSTDYHRLAVDYRADPKVSLCHMACQVGKGADCVEEVTFLYRLTNGACPKSYGVNVARLAVLMRVHVCSALNLRNLSALLFDSIPVCYGSRDLYHLHKVNLKFYLNAGLKDQGSLVASNLPRQFVGCVIAQIPPSYLSLLNEMSNYVRSFWMGI
ncbi:hypothetical protein Ancab_022489 [Ancistrocladus abbreviatus]